MVKFLSSQQIDANSNPIINVDTCVADYDAANKKYVDDNIGGGGDTLWEVYSSSYLRPTSGHHVIPYGSGYDLGRQGTSNTWNNLYLYAGNVCVSSMFAVYIGSIGTGNQYLRVETTGVTCGAFTVLNKCKLPVGTNMY